MLLFAKTYNVLVLLLEFELEVVVVAVVFGVGWTALSLHRSLLPSQINIYEHNCHVSLNFQHNHVIAMPT